MVGFISTFRIDFYMMTRQKEEKKQKKNAPIRLISDGKERVKGH